MRQKSEPFKGKRYSGFHHFEPSRIVRATAAACAGPYRYESTFFTERRLDLPAPPGLLPARPSYMLRACGLLRRIAWDSRNCDGNGGSDSDSDQGAGQWLLRRRHRPSAGMQVVNVRLNRALRIAANIVRKPTSGKSRSLSTGRANADIRSACRRAAERSPNITYQRTDP